MQKMRSGHAAGSAGKAEVRFTYDFGQEAAWPALHMSKSALRSFRGIAWKTAGSIIARAYKDLENEAPDKFSNLIRIGIDETSYRKGHRYVTVVVNHDTGGLIWAHEGHGIGTPSKFFEELTRTALYDKTCVRRRRETAPFMAEKYCPQAQRCIDPFHVVGRAMDALDEVRTRSLAEGT